MQQGLSFQQKERKIGLLSSVITSIIISSVISFVMVCVNMGISGNFLFFWLRSWLIGFCVALPFAHFVPRFSRKAAIRLFKYDSE